MSQGMKYGLIALGVLLFAIILYMVFKPKEQPVVQTTNTGGGATQPNRMDTVLGIFSAGASVAETLLKQRAATQDEYNKYRAAQGALSFDDWKSYEKYVSNGGKMSRQDWTIEVTKYIK